MELFSIRIQRTFQLVSTYIKVDILVLTLKKEVLCLMIKTIMKKKNEE